MLWCLVVQQKIFHVFVVVVATRAQMQLDFVCYSAILAILVACWNTMQQGAFFVAHSPCANMNFHLWKPKKMDQQTQAHGALYSVFFVFCVYLVRCETNTAKNTYSNVLPFYLCAHPNENFPSLNIGQASHQSRVQRLKPRLDHRRCLRILYMTQLPHR